MRQELEGEAGPAIRRTMAHCPVWSRAGCSGACLKDSGNRRGAQATPGERIAPLAIATACEKARLSPLDRTPSTRAEGCAWCYDKDAHYRSIPAKTGRSARCKAFAFVRDPAHRQTGPDRSRGSNVAPRTLSVEVRPAANRSGARDQAAL